MWAAFWQTVGHTLGKWVMLGVGLAIIFIIVLATRG